MNSINSRYNYSPAFGAKTGKNLEKFMRESYAKRPAKLEQFEKQKFNLDMAGFDDYTIEGRCGKYSEPVLCAYKHEDGEIVDRIVLAHPKDKRDLLKAYLNLNQYDLFIHLK